MKYWYSRKLDISFEEALDEVTFSLAEQGFGVLTKIDLQSAMKTKLEKDIEKYVVLGACNPSLAYEALESEQEVWLLVPCNVIVYEKEEKVFVSAILVSLGIGFIENKNIKDIAYRAEEMLKKAIDNIVEE